MGSWGTAIYSNDTASDVRDACRELYGLLDVQEAEKRLFTAFQEVLEQDLVDDDYASFWYALSDWQWKHGVLTDAVREKTLSLLESYAGLADWEEAGNKKDVEKRRGVLDKLKAQLLTPQPPRKISKIRLAKARHKPGDIIVFQACTSRDWEEDPWQHHRLSSPYCHADPQVLAAPCDGIEGVPHNGMYLAILCVGIERMPRQPYAPELFEEAGIYVWYDFASPEKPTVEALTSCGFLPAIHCEWEDINRTIFRKIEWIYRFAMDPFYRNIAFRACEQEDISHIEVLSCPGEVTRFEALFSRKAYSPDYCLHFVLHEAHSTFWEERDRSLLSGVPIDNLLEEGVVNPPLASPEEARKQLKAFINEKIS